MKFLLFPTLLLSCIYSIDAFTCPGVYHKVGDGCYTFTEGSFSWQEAYLVCQYAGGYLANIESFEEQNQLLIYRQGLSTTYNYWWFGANDIITDGDYRFVPSGRTLSYQNWYSTNPPSSSSSDCAVWYSYGNYWEINSCCNTYSGYGALCEADPDGIIG